MVSPLSMCASVPLVAPRPSPLDLALNPLCVPWPALASRLAALVRRIREFIGWVWGIFCVVVYVLAVCVCVCVVDAGVHGCRSLFTFLVLCRGFHPRPHRFDPPQGWSPRSPFVTHPWVSSDLLILVKIQKKNLKTNSWCVWTEWGRALTTQNLV